MSERNLIDIQLQQHPVYIHASPLHGLGLFAKSNIAKGKIILIIFKLIFMKIKK